MSFKKPIIFLSNNALYKTKLDKINNPKSNVHGKHFGSTIAKNIIKKFQPILCISDHIHEGYGKTKIGKIEFFGNNKEN